MQHLEGSGTPVLYIGRAHGYPPDVACGRLPAEIVGSNPTGVMDICLL